MVLETIDYPKKRSEITEKIQFLYFLSNFSTDLLTFFRLSGKIDIFVLLPWKKWLETTWSIYLGKQKNFEFTMKTYSPL